MSKDSPRAVQDGMADAWAELNTFPEDKLKSGQVTSA